jgi:hypothetical protein
MRAVPGKNSYNRTLRFSKIIKALLGIPYVWEDKMPKKDKPLTKKERDEKRKKRKEKQSKTQTR